MAAEIPVMQATADTLESLRAHEDLTDANSIGEMIADDPLMTLKVLIHASEQRGERETAPAETVTAALVMIGVTPFFRAFDAQPTVEVRLALEPEAMQGFLSVQRRAHRSANFALAMAVHRNDPHAAAIHAAALLHEYTEMLLWATAPRLALDIHARQAHDSALRSREAQLAVLGVPIHDIQSTLSAQWRLPTLLTPPTARARSPGTATGTVTVELAARLARHTSAGWDNPAVAEDVEQIAEALSMSDNAALLLLQSVDDE